jgi:[acyl-carrier-protein] S-malonyltransferase
MSESLIVLCPGQGAQAVGMGRAWSARPEAKAVLDEADQILGDSLGAPLSEICFEGPADRLNQTDVSQPAIYAVSVASWRGLLAEWGFGFGDARLSATAGLSLGEYTALHLAGAFSFEDGLRLVALRGQAMQEAAEATPSGMVALIGADEAKAQEVCSKAREGGVLVCANFNAPGQVVLSGDNEACERAEKVAGEMSLRATRLPVAGAFHSPIMQPAADRLGEALAKTEIHAPSCPVISNVTARPHEASNGGSGTIQDGIRVRLVEQLTSPVRWGNSCTHLASKYVTGDTGGATGDAGWHELAPGSTLKGLMRRIDRTVKVETHDEPSSE